MALVLLILSAVCTVPALVYTFLLGVQTWEHRRFARRRLAELDRCRPTGRAMVFVPCKGVDVGLEENLDGFFAQDYGDYEITFVVESPWDPACNLIARLMAQYPDRAAHLVVAGPAKDCGQKVHNLRVAIRRKVTSHVEFLVFADSDARPRTEWLRALVSRLDNEGGEPVGAVTGYRWLLPMRPTLANHLLYSINCGVATLLGSRKDYPIWGGSWAIRRTTFEAVGLLDAWRGTLSDDLVATRVLRRHALGVRYEPACMSASPLDGTLLGHLRFLRRQYVISRCYLPILWWGGLAGSLVPSIGWLAALTLSGWALATGSWLAIPGLGMCLALGAVGAARASIRQDLIGIYVPDCCQQLRRARRFDVWGNALAGLVNTLVMIVSCAGRRIRWRDVTYQIQPGGATRIIARRRPVVWRPDTVRLDESPWPELSDEDRKNVA